jgi:N-acetyl-gamma-glutamyl-phosphate reductase
MKTGVIGASGYAGGELLRILAAHPDFEPTVLTAHSSAGEMITSIHPALTSYSGKKFSSFSAADFKECKLIFLALPHGESASVIDYLPGEAKIVDLGADFRLTSAASWEKYYGGKHAGTWIYGLPELANSKEGIKGAKRVANPGCYATAISLGISPASQFIDLSDVVVVAASGTTGAGRSAKINLIASEVMSSLTSYKFGGVHQHTPEIEEATGAKISFTPILAPMPRGILATITAKLTSDIEVDDARRIYENFFSQSPFVHLLASGDMPKTSSVLGTNNTHIQIAIDSHAQRLVVSVAIDNLGKGAAGQAVQNANLMCGLPETAGLVIDGVSA